MNVNEMRNLVRDSASEAQCMIRELHTRDPDNQTFTQVGLLDGAKTVEDYVKHNELGVALEHLLYMIHESDIRYDLNRVRELHALATSLNLSNYYTAENIRRLGVANVFNVPEPD